MEMEVAEGKGEEGRYFSEEDNKPSAETKFLLINKTDGAIVKGSLMSVLCLKTYFTLCISPLCRNKHNCMHE